MRKRAEGFLVIMKDTNHAKRYDSEGDCIGLNVPVRNNGTLLTIGITNHFKRDLVISENEVFPITPEGQKPAWRIAL